MIHYKLVFKRIIRRIKYVFNLHEILTWSFESCEKCGHCFKLMWSIKNEKWIKVMGTDNGCLCIDCFIEIAKKKNIKITQNDFETIEIFNPD